MTKKRMTFDLVGDAPMAGSSFVYKGQEFVCLGWTGALSVHGYRLNKWRSHCTVCGAPFEQTTTRNTRNPTRTCLIHRRGLSVRAPVFG